MNDHETNRDGLNSSKRHRDSTRSAPRKASNRERHRRSRTPRPARPDADLRTPNTHPPQPLWCSKIRSAVRGAESARPIEIDARTDEEPQGAAHPNRRVGAEHETSASARRRARRASGRRRCDGGEITAQPGAIRRRARRAAATWPAGEAGPEDDARARRRPEAPANRDGAAGQQRGRAAQQPSGAWRTRRRWTH